MIEPVRFFQGLPRWLRRHKILRLACFPFGPVQKVQVNGAFDAYIDVRDGFARLVAIEDTFEEEFFSRAPFLFQDAQRQVFFDVGANFGLMSFGLAKSFGITLDAHLFEPNPHLVEIIQRSQTSAPMSNYLLHQVAAMDRRGESRLQFELHHTGAGFLQSNSASSITVETIPLDDYIDKHAIDRVDLVKIDVEGNETAVLQGLQRSLTNRVVRSVYFEYCPRHLDRAGNDLDPVDFVLSCGWEVFFVRSYDLCGRRTHQLSNGGYTLPLLEVEHPPREVAATDLLALPPGIAEAVTHELS